MKKQKYLLILLVILLASSCRGAAGTEAISLSLEKTQARMLISEVFSGVEGNNQADFVELYNAGTEIADLNGYTLYYQLNDASERIILYQWSEETLVPPLGYVALIQSGQLFPVQPDAVINQPLVPNRGGLSLVRDGEVLDQLSWGSGPAGMVEGHPAPDMKPGYSLQRSPQDLASGGGDTNDNGVDFSLSGAPSLMNTGSPSNHSAADRLVLEVDFPYQAKPGESFAVEFRIHNQTGNDLNNLLLRLPLPEFIYLEENSGHQQDGNLILIRIPAIKGGETYQDSIPLRAEYTFSSYVFRNTVLEAGNWDLPAFAGPFYGHIGGGAIPISTARELIDKEVVVEGTSTMYVGGFYAGSGAKFYLEDESGGVQVYVSGAGNSLVVPLGSIVRVRGKIEVYRDSIELIPAAEDLVEILEAGSEESYLAPERATLEQVSSSGEDFPGRLVEVEGRIARVEEFTYSYEIDLFDEAGNLLSLYLDKETGISIEEVESDQYYRITGIMEFLDGNLRLYPRLQSDLERVYPPGLYIQAQPPTTADPGEVFEVTLTVINRADEDDSNLKVQAPLDPRLQVVEVKNSGRIEGQTVIWEVPELKGGSQEIELVFLARLGVGADFARFGDYQVSSDRYPQPARGIETYTFAGESVPIWAVQGAEDRSPYVMARITTEGVVTGIFPELEGFWMQETASDNNPVTSPGLFISTGPDIPDLAAGDLVSVTGRVREGFLQTQLEVARGADVVVLGRSALPAPVILDPPPGNPESELYYEALEGSLVSVPGPALAVGPTTRYGEFALVLPKHGIDRAWQDGEHGMLIFADDGSSVTHQSRDSQDQVVAVGDSVSGLVGVLAYSFGNYKIEPVTDYQVQNQAPVIPRLPAVEEGYFSIMSWNVENLFDFVVPHPSSPPLPRVSEYKRDISRVAQTIEAAGFPTLIGLQEVENLEILEDISADPLLEEYGYQAALIEGTDSRGIDVGFLVRGDQAEIISLTQHPAPGNITSRPPLVIEIQLDGSQARLFLINNHFTSMSGGEAATEPRRIAQAEWNALIAGEIQSNNPGALLAVLGDLNSYYGSPPIQTLEAAGLTNLYDRLEAEERYSYIYQGLSQTLDHILVNADLESFLAAVDVLHCNADFPLPYSDDEGFLHKSDHDPLLGTFLVP